jgi:ATP-binding cassette subfamily G (WHITE) protein 2 (PDR)
MWREVTKLKSDPSVPIVMLVINFFEALIIASIFFNLRETTDSFFMRGGVLFMMVSTGSCPPAIFKPNCEL